MYIHIKITSFVAKWLLWVLFNLFHFIFFPRLFLLFSSLQYDVNGFAVIEDFLTEEEANELREAGLELCKNAPENDRKIFQMGKHTKETYFLESASKIGYFYEKDALDDNGNLLVDKCVSLNKVCARDCFTLQQCMLITLNGF